MCDSGEIPLEEGMSSILDLQPNEATFFFFPFCLTQTTQTKSLQGCHRRKHECSDLQMGFASPGRTFH